MEPSTSPDFPADIVEATANAFAIAFMSLSPQVKSRFFEIIKQHKGEKRNRPERLAAFKERRRQEQKENQNTVLTNEGLQKTGKQLPKTTQKERKTISDKPTKKKQQALQTPGITAAEATLIKFRNLNSQILGIDQVNKNNNESSKPYKAASKLISSGARFCELCGKYHQGNTCY